jgi:hypothetical protein
MPWPDMPNMLNSTLGVPNLIDWHRRERWNAPSSKDAALFVAFDRFWNLIQECREALMEGGEIPLPRDDDDSDDDREIVSDAELALWKLTDQTIDTVVLDISYDSPTAQDREFTKFPRLTFGACTTLLEAQNNVLIAVHNTVVRIVYGVWTCREDWDTHEFKDRVQHKLYRLIMTLRKYYAKFGYDVLDTVDTD